MNRDAIRKSLSGAGPFIIRTSDGKEFNVVHSEFVWVSPHNVIIEDTLGGVDIIDPLHVVSIRPGSKRRAKAA